MRRACLIVAATLLSLQTTLAEAQINFVIEPLDGVGEGFNDPTPVSPEGGNAATTLGQARLNAFNYAASLWGQRLSSPVTIRVSASIDVLTCTPTSAALGAAGTTTVHRDFPGAPLADTWYPQALANARAGVDLDPASADISAVFNGALDSGSCLGGSRWYYGLDGQPPAGDIDFVTVVLHELAHGLGFQTFVVLESGAKFLGHDDAYERRLEQHGATPAAYPSMTDAQRVAASTSDPQLQWLGPLVNGAAGMLSAGVVNGHVRMHGPASQQSGSSVSHFSTSLFPNELMEPFYSGPDHDGSVTLLLLLDLGWTEAVPAVPTVVPASSPATIALLVVALVGAALRLRRWGA